MSDDNPHLTLEADPADELMARFTDVLEALAELEHAARSITCPGCDPTGQRTSEVGAALAERFQLDEVDTLVLLGAAGDARSALLPILESGCGCGGHEASGEGGDG